jgi:phage protein D
MWTSDANSFYQANTFRAEIPMTGLPARFGPDWFASQSDIEVNLFAGFPPDPTGFTAADLTSIFVGLVDDPVFDWEKRLITISGRDYTGKLIDTKTSEKYPNNTASQIANILATKYGLTPVVTATTTKVGRYYEIDNVRSQNERTEWDLLTWLAREERFNVYVQGKELHFGPPAQTGTPYQITYVPPSPDGPAQANVARFTTSRNLTVAKDVKVTVRSWNAKNKKAFERTVTGTKVRNKVTSGQGKSSSPPQQYTYSIPGLTPDQAQQRAQQILSELSRHEMKLSFAGPADNNLGAGDTIQLSGTGTAFDQTYYPDSIVRTLAAEGGYSWEVSAKNHSPDSEPDL